MKKTKMLNIGLSSLVAIGMLASSPLYAKSPVVSTAVCKMPGETNKITLYQNKTVSIKWTSKGKSGSYKARWSKEGNGIVIEEKTKMPGAGGWMTYGILKTSKRGTVLYNPEYYGSNSPKCKLTGPKAKKTKKAKRSKQRTIINAGSGYKHFPTVKYVCNGFRTGPNITYFFKKNGTYATDNKYNKSGVWVDKGDQAVLYPKGAPIGPNSWDMKITNTDKGIYRTIEGVPNYRGRCYLN